MPTITKNEETTKVLTQKDLLTDMFDKRHTPLSSSNADEAEKIREEIMAEGKERGNQIFSLKFRRGPAWREVPFWAVDQKDATEKAERAIAWMNGRENARCTLAGIPTPFILDIDAEMLRDPLTGGKSRLLL